MIEYKLTNESLDAITKGLDLNNEDVVLAAGGSGDQAFAILEFAKEVKVVDISDDQLEYIQKRLQHIIDGRFESFLAIDKFGLYDDSFNGGKNLGMTLYNWKRRNEYFLNPGRLENIRKKVSKLTLLPRKDIGYISEIEKNLTKIYFSNIREIQPSYDFRDKRLERIANNLPIDGLIYFTLSDGLRWKVEDTDTNLPPELKLDEKLSALARSYQSIRKWNMWFPTVYRVVDHT